MKIRQLLLLSIVTLGISPFSGAADRKPSSACTFVENREWKLDGKIPSEDEVKDWASNQCRGLMVDLAPNCDLGVPSDYLGRNCESKTDVDWTESSVSLKNPPPFQVTEWVWGQGKNSNEAIADMKNEVAKLTEELIRRVLKFSETCESLGGIAKTNDVESKTPQSAQQVSGSKMFEAQASVSAGGLCLPKARSPRFVRGEFRVRFNK